MKTRRNTRCRPTPSMARRRFLMTAGASALACQAGIFDFASSLFAGERKCPGRTRVRAVFVRPPKDRYWMSWPGACYDVEARQTEYTKVLAEAAGKLGIELDVSPVPLHQPDDVSNFLERIQESPPDGLILTVMHLECWPQLNYIINHRADVPAVVFSPLGTSFTEYHQRNRNMARTLVAATWDSQFLASAMRMLNTIREMKDSRICIITDAVQGERTLSPIGTTLQHLPLKRWTDELSNADMTDEMREIAKYYAIESKSIVEPEREDLLNAAKNYVVARRIMAAEKCRGISVDCARLVNEKRISCGPCLAWSRLLDEGYVGACEADSNAAISMLLSGLLFDRPGFMQDPAPDTVHNTLIGSHCTCATKLAGYQNPHQPFALRNHAESNSGVAVQVLWPVGQEVTLLKFQNPGCLVAGTGRIVNNIESSSAGGCRTSVEIQLDDVADARDVKGHHQLIVFGKLDKILKSYGQLAGIEVVHI